MDWLNALAASDLLEDSSEKQAVPRTESERPADAHKQERNLKRAVQSGDATSVEQMLKTSSWWRSALQSSLKLVIDAGTVRAFATAIPHFFESDGGAAAALLCAAKSGRLSTVRALLDAGVSPDSTPRWSKLSPLHAACANGHIRVAAALLDQGADIHAGSNGRTPMHFASLAGHVNILKFLLERGANVDFTDDTGCTPLHYASSKGDVFSMRLLLDHGAEVSLRGQDGNTPLHLVAQNAESFFFCMTGRPKTCGNYEECTRLLIERKANLSIANYEQNSPFYIALSRFQNEKIIQHLINAGVDVFFKGNNDETALHLAVSGGYVEYIEILLRMGLDINARTKEGITPLLQSAQYSDLGILETLIRLGADISIGDNKNNTPIHYAANCGYVNTLNVLLKAGADVRSLRNDGATPLHLAAARSSDCVTALVLAAADVNARTENGRTPVHFAALNWESECLEVLSECGADLQVLDASCWSAMHCAADAGRIVPMRWLESRGLMVNARAAGSTPLHLAAAAGHSGAVRELLELGAEVDATDADGRTALHLAARGTKWRHWETVHVLLDVGADRAARDSNGQTPEQMAHKSSVLHLLSRWKSPEATVGDNI